MKIFRATSSARGSRSSQGFRLEMCNRDPETLNNPLAGEQGLDLSKPIRQLIDRAPLIVGVQS